MNQENSIDEREKPTKEFKALGHSDATRFEGFETFAAPATLSQVSLSVDHMTALCPVTNQPDYYAVDITYTPARRVLETKTVKLYLETFRETGIFAEHLAAQIAEDIQQATLSANVSIMLRQRVRGGIETTAFAEINLDDESGDENDKALDAKFAEIDEKIDMLRRAALDTF